MRPTDDLESRLRARLSAWQSDGLLRALRPPRGIDFCSNDYLGLAAHPLLKQQMANAVIREGCGSTGSRLLRGERDAFTELESEFARFKGAERALYFSSGYLANLAVLSTLPEPGDVIFSDERNHASLIDGIRLSSARRVIFPHNDVAALSRLMGEESGPGQRFLVTESLFSMDGDMAPLGDYAQLCHSRRAALIVDEAHAVGIYGARGSGLAEAAGIEPFISINTAGKALGVCGAFVAGPVCAMDYLIQRARPFVFSTAAPPAVAAAIQASLKVIRSEPWRRSDLLARSRYLRRLLADSGLPPSTGDSQIVPIMLGENDRALHVARILQQAGFDARAIRPPSVPPGTARLRISVNSNLSESVLDSFVAALTNAIKESAACFAASS